MYKKVKLAGIISTLILSASAYSAEMTVGFSQIGSESGWRAAETSVAKSEAQKRGITLKIADAQQKQENQIKAIRSFIAQGVDAIFIAPVVQTGWEPVLQEAKEAEIPVFLLDRNITVKDDGLFMTGVAADSVHEGGLYFEPFTDDLKPVEVIVGDRSTITRADLAEALGDARDHVTAFKARPAFGSFDVVRNKNDALWR